MVGYDVQDQPQAMIPERLQQREVLLRRPDFGVEQLMIGDVVAVRTTRRGLEIGRGVAVRYAQVGQIGNDRRGVAEGEAGMELEAVRRLRHGAPPPEFLARRGEQLGGIGGVIRRRFLLQVRLSERGHDRYLVRRRYAVDREPGTDKACHGSRMGVRLC